MISLRTLTSLALLTALACGGSSGGTPTSPPAPAGVQIVEILENRFEPKQLTVQPGTTVRWVLRGNADNHTTTEMETTWDSGFVFLNSGDTFEHTFSAADEGSTFEYSCVSHKACCEMQGSVRVGDSAPNPSPGY